MALFVTSVCQVVGDTVISQAAWSNADNVAALTAFTVDDQDKEINQVVFANNEGELFASYDISHDYEATVMQWHPYDRVLAIGWADGMISTSLVDGKTRPTTSYSNTSQHHAPIAVMKWNPSGKRLVTGDKKGVICVWSADTRGVLNIMRQYKRKGEITQLVFCMLQPRIDLITALPANSKANPNDPLKIQNHTPSFFFGTERGTLAYADDMGNCTDIQTLSSPVETLLFFSEQSYLLLITRSMLLITYHIAQDGKINKLNSVKLSVQNPEIANSGLGAVIWIYAGIFAMATEEKMLRVYDVMLNEGYNLSLSAALGNDMDRSDRVTSVAFDNVKRHLCVGTQCGWVVVYKYNGANRDLGALEGDEKPAATSSSDWELVFKAPVNAHVLQMSFHQARGYLSVITEDQALFLTESTLHSFVYGDASLIQLNSHEIHVQIGLNNSGGGSRSRGKGSNNDNSTQLAVNTGMQLRGIAMTHTAFVVWTNKVAKVYRLDLQTAQITPMEIIKSPCALCTIADATFIVEEVLFVLEQNSSVIKVVSFSGVSRGSITFTEQEGVPVNMSVNNKYLSIITNKGCVKVFDIHTPTKAKLLGSAGTFHIDMNLHYLKNNNMLTSNKSNKNAVLPSEATSVNHNSNIKIRQISVNCTGTMIAILIDKVEGTQSINYPDTVLYVYDRNKGSVLTFNFNTVKRFPISAYWDDNDERLLCCEAQKIREKSSSGAPSAAVAKEANAKDSSSENSPTSNSAKANNDDGSTQVEVYLLFATAEKGLLMQDSFSLSSPLGQLMGFSVPHIYFKHDSYTKQATADSDAAEGPVVAQTNIIYNNNRIVTKMMRDFAGIEDVNDNIRSVLLDFSYFMTLGKLDEAYRVIKDINSVHIWENMAQMCVKTRRLDVAEVCLSHMGNLRGLEIVKDSRNKLLNNNLYLDSYAPNTATVANNTLVVIGVLAIQLGLLDDAVAIFKEAKRFDLLNKLYQDAGVWQKAIKVAESQDRMHLKTTYYNYAKYLEHNNSINDAIEYYKLAEIDHVEVPRMLFYLNRIDDLNEYIIHSDNLLLLKWWAAYLESIDRMDKAKKYYAKAKDYLSLVRIACFKGDFEGAAEVINESNDRASSYHFARQLEHQNEFQEAINFYALSGCYHHCIRLAKAHELDGELMRYALKSTPAYMISCAEYYEQKGEYDKAIQLYYKGNDITYALELCFRIGEEISSTQPVGRNAPPHPYAAAAYDMINTIAQELGVNSSPQLLARCADFLVSNKQFAKAIELYVMAKKHYNAIEICVQYKIVLNDDIVEQLTPTEAQVPDANERKEILKQIGKLLKKQGLFMQASKKFTQANDRIQAMKCLVKHGDSKLITQFANISRSREIYILAANYLQQMNWREDIEIMKFIILFYNKAKAYVQLSNFYEHCATVEVDDYQDYGKALSAYNEALKYLNKLLNETHVTNAQYSDSDIHLAQQMLGNYEQRMMKINKFLEAKKALKGDSNTMITICEALLQDPDIDEAVRLGDIFSMLVEFYVANRQYSEAYNHVKEMQSRKVNVNQFLENSQLEEIYKAVGKSAASTAGRNETKEMDGSPSITMFNNNSSVSNQRDDEELDEEIGEEVDEEPEEPKRGGRPPPNAIPRGGYNTYNRK